MRYQADRELARRVLDRRPDAVRAFADRVACVAPFVRRCARRSAAQVADAQIEDIVQETYLAIWRKLERYRGESRLETWACGFAYIELRRWREREARLGERRVETLEEPRVVDAEVDDSLDRIQRELDRIGPPTSVVIRLKHVDGMTFEEIAAHLDLSSGTAKSLHYRGLARLRDRLRGVEEGLAG